MARVIQKIIKVGSSVAVVIPSKSVSDLDFKVGDSVRVTVDEDTKILYVQSVKNRLNPDVVVFAKRFIKRYRKELRALARM